MYLLYATVHHYIPELSIHLCIKTLWIYGIILQLDCVLRCTNTTSYTNGSQNTNNRPKSASAYLEQNETTFLTFLLHLLYVLIYYFNIQWADMRMSLWGSVQHRSLTRSMSVVTHCISLMCSIMTADTSNQQLTG